MKLLVTTSDAAWQEEHPSSCPSTGYNPLRLTGEPEQTILGFGGCFNEMGGRELLSLTAKARTEVLEALFGDTGCAFDFCRMPIGASDYALSWYSLNDTPDDYAMEHFSIERDRRYLLPFIQQACGVSPSLRFLASPWSPPAWMKVHNRYNGSSLRDDPTIYAAYANYLLRFIQTYRAEGVAIAQMHVQNEPNSGQKFPSCVWTGAQMRNFIRDYLGPCFENTGEMCEIWAGTIEKGALIGWLPETLDVECYRNWAHTILSDPGARRYVKGIGYQWNGKGALAQIRANWPEIPFIQTENECGDGRNSWSYAFYVFDLIWQYFHHGAAAYVYWNMVLPPEGESTWGWKQNSLITLDRTHGTVIFNPEFHVMKHISHFVRGGAKYLPLRGDTAAFSMLFENPDGTRVLVIANPGQESNRMEIRIPGLPDCMEIVAGSLNTIVFQA